jgi:hypothetical protein
MVDGVKDIGLPSLFYFTIMISQDGNCLAGLLVIQLSDDEYDEKIYDRYQAKRRPLSYEGRMAGFEALLQLWTSL